MIIHSHTHTHIAGCTPNQEAGATSIYLHSVLLGKEKFQDGGFSVRNPCNSPLSPINSPKKDLTPHWITLKWVQAEMHLIWFGEKIEAVLLHIDKDRWWYKYISITCNFIFISKVKTKAITRSLPSPFRVEEKSGILKGEKIFLIYNYKPDISLYACTMSVCAFLCECVCWYMYALFTGSVYYI